MDEELENWHGQLASATDNEQVHLFIRFCERLIELHEEGKLGEEDAAYHIIDCMQFESLAKSPVCESIFDTAGTAELPREISYAQAMGTWNTKTADVIKEKEWRELVAAVKNARDQIS